MGGPRYVWQLIQDGLREREREVRPEIKTAGQIILEQARLVVKEYVTKGIEPRLDDKPPTAVPSGQSTAVQYRISPAPEVQEQTLVEDEHSSISEADDEGVVVNEDTVPLLIDFGLPDAPLQPPIEPNNPPAQLLSAAIDLPVTTDAGEGHGDQSITTAVETRQADIPANLSTMPSGLRNRAQPAVAGLELPSQVAAAHSANSPATPPGSNGHVPRPPILVKVTGYRVLNTVLVIVLGTWKGVASYRGDAVISNTLDIILGVFLAIALYWLGLYETVEPPRLKWLFHVDYVVVLQRRWITWRARWLTFAPPTLRRRSLGGEDDMELEDYRYTPRSSPPSSPHDQC
ncbi:hypothetical protein BC629DRAFT_687885 [Irpex lacteus]|nr:hypothetical protein BC629DRAFT_687885 [Irpex lacteus]